MKSQTKRRLLSTTPSRLNQDSLEGDESDEEVRITMQLHNLKKPFYNPCHQVEESNSEEDFLTKYLDPKDRTRQIPVKITSHPYLIC